MAGSRGRGWAEMDHDASLLLERVAHRSRVEERGPIPELLSKKDAEQALKTAAGYRTALLRFYDFLGGDATVGDVTDAAGHAFLGHLKHQGLSENAIATYFKWLKAFTRWMHKRGWT